MLTVIIVVIVIVLIVGVILLISGGIRIPEEEDPLAARLAEYSQRGDAVSLEEIELSQPFRDRVLFPMIRRLGEISTRFTPQHVLESTAKRLEMAGNPARMDASAFLSLRFVGAGMLGGLLFVMFLFTSRWSVGTELLMSLVFGVIGFYLPQLWLRGRITNRQREIRKAMPDALDLLTICVEAGLGFDAAMSRVYEKWNNELSLALGRAIREIQLGKLRREALKDMADRIGIPEMTSFVAAVIQSEVLGVSMAKVLRIQSDQMRIKRRQRAEEEANKAPIKMIIPMGLFMFPSLIIILMTPAAFRFMGSFSQFMR